MASALEAYQLEGQNLGKGLGISVMDQCDACMDIEWKGVLHFTVLAAR